MSILKPKESAFSKMVLGSVAGITTGMILGLAFALLIATISRLFSTPTLYGAESGMPYEIASFLGMGFGAIVGGILGGVAALRE